MASTVRSRRLGADLRRLREAASLNAEAVAQEMGFSRPKLSRIESGEVRVSQNDLKALLRAYGVLDAAQQPYLVAAREARRVGWWQTYQDALPREYADYIALESTAEGVRSSQPILVPGLLQTEAYTRAVILANPSITPPADVESLIRIRRERQAILDQSENPPRLWFIIGESAIRQHVGGSAVMRAQLQRLATLADFANVVIQVLPHSAGAHAGLNGPFVIFSFAGEREPDIVCLENLTGTLYLEQPSELAGYNTAFDHLRASALNPADSLALIQQASKEL